MSFGDVPIQPIDDPVDAVRSMAAGAARTADRLEATGLPTFAATVRRSAEQETARADRMERDRQRRERLHWRRVWRLAADIFEEEWRATHGG